MSSQNQTNFLVFALLFGCFINSSYGYQFAVGGKDGWVLNPSDSYSSWTGRNRFLVGDTLLFKYNSRSDSVLVVTKTDYDSCNAANPTQKLDGGSSVFALDRSGPFYFITGNKTNCDQGQKLIVVVISPRNRPTPPTGATSPVSPPAPTSPGTGALTPGGSPGPTAPGTGALTPGGSPGPTAPGAGTTSPAGSPGTLSPSGSPEPLSPAEGAPGPAMFGSGPTAASGAPGPGSYGSEGPSPSGETGGLGPSTGSPVSSGAGSGTPADANSPDGSPRPSSVAAPPGTPGILLGWLLVGVSVGRFVSWH